MPTSFLEIVELPDGRIELRRAEDEGSLVTLNFSEDAKAFLQGQHVEVAKAMLAWACRWPGVWPKVRSRRTTAGHGFFTEPRLVRRCFRSASLSWRSPEAISMKHRP